MPYTKTTWTEGVTKLRPTNINNLDGGVATGASLIADAFANSVVV